MNGEALLTIAGVGSVGLPNPFLWDAVDDFRAQGYQIDAVVLGGVGSVGNPNEFYIVLLK